MGGNKWKKKKQIHPGDTNGDGKVICKQNMYLEFKRKELDDQDLK